MKKKTENVFELMTFDLVGVVVICKSCVPEKIEITINQDSND